MMEFCDKIKDPILGWLPITELEKEIIARPVFNRLQYVTQMSLAYVTFPGAHHTRYEHSIGTMHIAYEIARRIPDLRTHYGNKFSSAMQLLRLSALLHDVGHPPFSHAVEWAFKKSPTLSSGLRKTHEDYTRMIIESNEDIGTILSQYNAGNRAAAEYACAVAALAVGDKESLLKMRHELYRSSVALIPVLNGDLDADKIDYILRDHYHCGFPTGVDIDEVLDSLTLHIYPDNPEENELLMKPEKISAVETLLYTRLRLIDLIHNETRNRIANLMLMRLVADKIKNLTNPEMKMALVDSMHLKWRDFDMCNYISQSSNSSTRNEASERSDEFGERILKGDPFRFSRRIYLKRLPPYVRADLYLVEQRPQYFALTQKKIEESLGIDLQLDFCLISTPPLTLQLDQGEPRKRPYLFDASNVIKGIVEESFARSFVGIYSDSARVNELDLNRFFELIQQMARDIRKDERDGGYIQDRDLIICVLQGIRDFEKEHFPDSSLWTYGIGKFQQFIYRQLRDSKIRYKVKTFKNLTSKYDVCFFRELQRLIFCGLVDERRKEITYEPAFYNRRFDHRINSFGEYYYSESLREFYQEVRDAVRDVERDCEEMIRECIRVDKTADKVSKYDEFVVRIKKVTKEIDEKGGCILVPS